MPRVKIDYVVSFSSEDTENPASNLLQWDISKKKWLCPRGESSCSVVLQLAKSVKISAVNIGAYHAALVEVLVGRSETPNDPFQVLVPSSIFLSPIDSRKEENVEKVRSFSSEQLAEGTRNQKWDRVRVVCSQPYNKQCKFGLSFIQINEPEGSINPANPAAPIARTTSAVPPRLLALDTCSSDEDEFKPGQLFATHSQSASGESQNSDTGAQIRQATSQALKNISDTCTKLVRTPMAKTNRKETEGRESVGDRQRDSLMYGEDDDQPHAKIDRVVQHHRDRGAKHEAHNRVANKDDKNKKDKPKMDSSLNKERNVTSKQTKEKLSTKTMTPNENSSSSDKNKNIEKDSRKRSHSERKDKNKDEKSTGLKAGPVSDEPHRLMRDVVFVLSGYENPRRGSIRTAALAMGALCLPNWDHSCAFPNTPKLRQVRASEAGRGKGGEGAAVAVRGEWVEECARRRRLLPWQWFATEPNKYIAPPQVDDQPDDHHSECDTDDEIEKVLSKQKKQRMDRTPSPSAERGVADISRESDVQFVRDERVQGSVTLEDTDTDATDDEHHRDQQIEKDESKCLGDFFEGHTFAIDESVVESGLDAELLARYVRAYGGTLLQDMQSAEEVDVDFVLCGGGDTGRVGRRGAVRGDWVWHCHRLQALLPTTQYQLA